MAEPVILSKTSVYCYGCLCNNDERKLHSYNVQNKSLKTILQIEHITLCYLCRKIAQRTEVFVENVQSNQILLENINVITDADLQSIKCQIHPVMDLVCVPLAVIEMEPNDNINTEECKTVVYDSKKEVQIKEELKDETNDSFDDLENSLIEEQEFIGDDNVLDSYVKDEDDCPLKLLKKELELEGINIRCYKKQTKKEIVGKRRKRNKNIGDIKIELFTITRDQCMEERARKAVDKKYLETMYKCEDCVKGFNFKKAFDLHMETHKKSNGDYECDICKQRMSSDGKLIRHRRYHTQRYRCLECGFVRVNRLTVKDHFTATHCQDFKYYRCPHCFKEFHRQVSLRKHITYMHSNKDRVQCAYCRKTYSSKESLKAHLMIRHTTEVSAGKKIKKHICQDCGMAFNSPSHLKKHSIKHSHKRDYYCVECDKSFKTDSVLKHHLKTAMPHTNYLELPLGCSHCEKRFAIRRDLERHMNRVHLNIKPFQCDQCEKAYINSWSLNEHRRLIHEGYKRPLKFPCPMCDKVFARNQVLKSHLRTHTGERPYQCSKCPAQFSQASILGTHMKLIHLKLTRDGRPKGSGGLK